MNSVVEFFQQYGPLFGILTGVASVLGVAFTIYKTAHDRRVKDLLREIESLKREIEDLGKIRDVTLAPLVVELKGQLTASRATIP